MPTIFVDANLFFQCQEPSALPWEQLADGKALVLVLIPRAVQQEIDKHKHTGNSRRARRARKASSMFRQIIDAPDLKKVVRDSGPRVEMSFPPPSHPNRQRPPLLDLTLADDRIVEEALTYQATHPSEDVRLLTHDTNLMLTARQFGLPYVAIPDEWLLAPEPDERDKALAEVRRRLDALEREYPALAVAVTNARDEPVDCMRLAIDAYPDLAESDIDWLVEQVRARHPIAEKFEKHGSSMPTSELLSSIGSLGFGSRWEPPSEEEIERYREVEYPNWLKKVRQTFTQLPRQLEFPRRHATLTLMLTNDGARPAENVVVEVRALGGMLIAPPGDQEEDERGRNERTRSRMPSLPSPPRPPVGHHTSLLSRAEVFDRLGIDTFKEHLSAGWLPDLEPVKQDRYGFYWEGGRPIRYIDEWKLTCMEFRHKVDPEIFEIVLFVPRDFAMSDAAVTCRVTASNLPDPVSVTVPITVGYVQKDTFEAARHLTL